LGSEKAIKQTLLQRMDSLSRHNIDKVDGFINGLIAQKETQQKESGKRKPLLVKDSDTMEKEEFFL
jgi:hypothetical protein